MLGTIVNAAAILVGGTLGLLLKKGIPERVSGGIMQGLGLVVIYIGISGMLKGQNALIATISLVVGGAIVAHNLPHAFGVHHLYEIVAHSAPAWLSGFATVCMDGFTGLLVGAVVLVAVTIISKFKPNKAARSY